MNTKIAKLLTKRGLSATELARKAGVAPSTVTRLMSGETPLPTDNTATKLAEALGVEKRSILG